MSCRVPSHFDLAFIQSPLWAPHRGEIPDDEDISSFSPDALLARKPTLAFVALLAILDPPREEVIEAVKVAHAAGISVKMITGDHAMTGLAIGKMLGIAGNNNVTTGPEIDAMSDERLAQVLALCVSLFMQQRLCPLRTLHK